MAHACKRGKVNGDAGHWRLMVSGLGQGTGTENAKLSPLSPINPPTPPPLLQARLRRAQTISEFDVDEAGSPIFIPCLVSVPVRGDTVTSRALRAALQPRPL